MIMFVSNNYIYGQKYDIEKIKYIENYRVDLI